MQNAGTAETRSGIEARRVETMVQAVSSGRSETLTEVTHEARNMVAAMGLYCDLLEQPGVLSAPFAHYGQELRQVASASLRLVEKLAEIDAPAPAKAANAWRSENGATERWPARLPGSSLRDVRTDGWDFLLPAAPVTNLAAELLATRNLLAALAGPGVAVTVEAERGNRPTRITAEDLTRVLVNLVKNSVEASPKSGRIQVSLRERVGLDGNWLVLAVEDNGPGIPEEALERVFESGYSKHAKRDGRPAMHRGLGLAITRAIIETAGGRIFAENRIAGGARMVMEQPAGV